MSSRQYSRLTIAALFLIYWGLTTHGKYSNSGDEPHYLMMAQSLRADRDLDLSNNYALDQGASFGAVGLQHELHAIPARDGRLRPVHDIGVAVTLLPVYAVATTVASLVPPDFLRRFRMSQGLFAYALISLAVMAVVLLAARVTFTALEQAGLEATRAAAVVFVMWGTVPILANAYEVFPEPFALLVTALAAREWTAATETWTRRTWILLAAAGALPWYHRKYAVYAVALAVVVLWRKRDAIVRLPLASRAAAAILFVAPSAVLAGWTYYYWGNIGGPLTLDRPPFSLDAFAHGLPGLLLDRENGLFWWAPVCVLLPAALAKSRQWAWLLPLAALIIPSAAHDQWWAGFSPACRFVVPLMPILCLLGVGLLQCRPGRFAIAVAILPQVLIAAYGWQHPHTLWPRGDGHNRVLEAFVGAADTLLPSFRVPSTSTLGLTLLALGVVAAINAAVILGCRPGTPVSVTS